MGAGCHTKQWGGPRRQRLASVFGDTALIANSQHPSRIPPYRADLDTRQRCLYSVEEDY